MLPVTGSYALHALAGIAIGYGLVYGAKYALAGLHVLALALS